MSGPKVAIFGLDPFTVLLAAAAIRAGQAVAESHARASDYAAASEIAHQSNTSRQIAAGHEAIVARDAAVAAAEARFAELLELANGLGLADPVRATRLDRPHSDDPALKLAYISGLESLVRDLEALLLGEVARRKQAQVDEEEVDQLPESLTQEARSQTLGERLVARISHLGEIPADIASLAKELDSSLPGERRDLLASELRRRIQMHIDETVADEVRKATATVLDQSLKDLGYEVEPISQTLFVEGGVVHFRGAGWGDYMVRLRIDAKGSAANFNVVRAVDGANAERSVLDHLAEDRWCAEFPKLLATLAQRGVKMQVTRHLAAGELPVQLVDRGKLPRFADEDDESSVTRLQERAIK